MIIFLLLLTLCFFIYLLFGNTADDNKNIPTIPVKKKMNLEIIMGLDGGNLINYIYTECYPYIIFPKEKINEPLQAKFIDLNSNSVENNKLKTRGKSESLLFEKIKESQFSKHFYWGNHSLGNFYPDISYMDFNESIFIDIEIDEPYAIKDREEIHFIEYTATKYYDRNSFRDNYFVNNGWTVIRFAEEQIIKDSNGCLLVIENCIKYLMSSSIKLSRLPWIKMNNLPRWTFSDSLVLALNDYRETGNANHNPKRFLKDMSEFQKWCERKDSEWYEKYSCGIPQKIKIEIRNLETNKLFRKVDIELSRNGFFDIRIFYDEAGKPSKINEYIYKSYIRKDYSSETDANSFHFYDRKSRRYKTNEYDENYQMLGYELYDYDLKSLTLECNSFSLEGKMKSKSIYHFDNNGNVIQTESQYLKKSSEFIKDLLISRNIYRYDSENKIIENERMTSSTHSFHKFEHHKFDSFGNFTSTTWENGNGVKFICTRVIDYYMK